MRLYFLVIKLNNKPNLKVLNKIVSNILNDRVCSVYQFLSFTSFHDMIIYYGFHSFEVVYTIFKHITLNKTKPN